MFRTKLTLAVLAVAAAFLGLSSSRALAGYDSWYASAISWTATQPAAPFITDTLAPGGASSDQSYRFITDTLAPGGGPNVVSTPASRGFDWGDAGIGAVVMGGLALVLLASRRAVQRRGVVAV